MWLTLTWSVLLQMFLLYTMWYSVQYSYCDSVCLVWISIHSGSKMKASGHVICSSTVTFSLCCKTGCSKFLKQYFVWKVAFCVLLFLQLSVTPLSSEVYLAAMSRVCTGETGGLVMLVIVGAHIHYSFRSMECFGFYLQLHTLCHCQERPSVLIGC